MGPGDINARLASWSDDEASLLGIAESREVEFKTVYHLDSDKQKVEFAKDVAGMANSGGGLIVVGVETRRDEGIGRDVSVRIRPLAPGIADLAQMEDIARTWIYPPQREVRIKEWPDSEGRLILSIEVPAFTEIGGLCLILGPGDEPDRRTIGVPIRSESRVDFHLAPEIYEWIRRGRLQAALGPEPTYPTRSKEDADAALERVQSELDVERTGGEAAFFLQAWPTEDTRLERIHDRDGVKGVFLDPPPHRETGFGWWGLQPELDRDGGLRLPGGDRLVLWVTPSAVATLGVGQAYLTWAMEKHAHHDQRPLINPTALGELTYEFCRTYLLVIRFCERLPSSVFFRFGLFNALQPQPLRLGEGLPTIGFSVGARPAPENELIETTGAVNVHPEEGRAETVTALILRRFYERFGWGREAIPHLSEDGERYDPSKLEQS